MHDGGKTHILLEKGFELAVDVYCFDEKIHSMEITVGSGFQAVGNCSLNVEIPVTLEELKAVHERLGELIKGLSAPEPRKKQLCPNCQEWLILDYCVNCGWANDS
jgi:hypothetical protein